MKINPYIREQSAVIKRNSVVIGPLKRESVTLDISGNEIDRRTKRIIKRVEQ